MKEEMSDMKDVPMDILVLCQQQMTGFCLRRFQHAIDVDEIEAYDENEVFDDSELRFYGWWPLPEYPV